LAEIYLHPLLISMWEAFHATISPVYTLHMSALTEKVTRELFISDPKWAVGEMPWKFLYVTSPKIYMADLSLSRLVRKFGIQKNSLRLMTSKLKFKRIFGKFINKIV